MPFVVKGIEDLASTTDDRHERVFLDHPVLHEDVEVGGGVGDQVWHPGKAWSRCVRR
jgi:hypothetical protein